MTKFHHYILPALPGLAIVIGCFLDDISLAARPRAAAAAALVGLPLLALVAVDLASARRERPALHLAVLVRLHQHAAGPALAAGARFPGAAHRLRGAVRAARARRSAGARIQRAAAVALCLAAVAFTFYLLDGYMRRPTPYWTQKPLIASYYKMRRSPDEHLHRLADVLARRNLLHAERDLRGPEEERTVFLGDRNAENLKAWMEKHRGRRAFFLIERSRYGTLETMVPPTPRKTLKIVDDSNMKFCLASADL